MPGKAGAAASLVESIENLVACTVELIFHLKKRQNGVVCKGSNTVIQEWIHKKPESFLIVGKNKI